MRRLIIYFPAMQVMLAILNKSFGVGKLVLTVEMFLSCSSAVIPSDNCLAIAWCSADENSGEKVT